MAVQTKLGGKIKKLRIANGLSQEDLSEKLNVQRSTISQIENNQRQLSIDELVKLSKIFNVSVESLLGIATEPEIKINPLKDTDIDRKNKGIRINVPQRNIDKLKQVFLYILNKVGSKPNIGETVIYKLLYFIDFDYYEKYEEQLIGATYIKNNYGPTPVEFTKVTGQMIEKKEIIKVKNKYFQYPQTKYLPLKGPDLSLLKASEIEVIDEVLSKLSDKNAAQISEYSHNDVPWLYTKNNEVIEYEAVFYRTAPYSVREYQEDASKKSI